MYSQSFNDINNSQKHYLNHTYSSNQRIRKKSEKQNFFTWLFIGINSKHKRNLEQECYNFGTREII